MANDCSSPTTGAQLDALLHGGAEASGQSPAGRQIEALGALIGIGLKIARAIERRVDEAGDQASLADLNAAAIAYARVGRAVRQSILLQDKLAGEQRIAAAKAADLRARAVQIVHRAIEDGRRDTEQAERLAAEAAERLEQERYGDILIRPVGRIIADLCRDLGFDPDWQALDGDILSAEAFARGDAAASSPRAAPIEVRWLDDDEPPVGDSS
jgi:hypothetical protein